MFYTEALWMRGYIHSSEGTIVAVLRRTGNNNIVYELFAAPTTKSKHE